MAEISNELYQIEVRRPERFAETLREEISEIVGYELDDPRLISVTVTDVIVADNMRDAKVFVTIEGDEKEIKEALQALRHASTFIRQQITLNLDLRHAPHVHFIRDTVGENAARIEEVIQGLAQRGEFEERNQTNEE